MLEVAEPSAQDRIQLGYDPFYRLAGRSSCTLSYRFAQTIHTFTPDGAPARFKPVPGLWVTALRMFPGVRRRACWREWGACFSSKSGIWLGLVDCRG